MTKVVLGVGALVFVWAAPAPAQPAFTGSHVYDFQAYAGAGLAAVPGPGQLSTDAFSAFFGSSLNCSYGSTSCTAATFAHGLAPSGFLTGLWTFTTDAVNRIFGVVSKTPPAPRSPRCASATTPGTATPTSSTPSSACG